MVQLWNMHLGTGKHELVVPSVNARESNTLALKKIVQSWTMFEGTVVVVHEDVLPHGDLYDGHLLSLTRAMWGVIEVESNEPVLLLLEPFLIHD